LLCACALLALAFCLPALADPPGGSVSLATLMAGAVEPGRAALVRAPAVAAFTRELLGALAVDLRHEPVPVSVDPSGYHGHADVSIALPFSEHFSLRNGLRVRYRDEPGRDLTALDWLPTTGIEIRF
jgi:hypothetical protein